MDQDRTYEQVAESYFEALLRSGRDARAAARDMQDAAAFLAAEGQLEVAQALRAIYLKHRMREVSATAPGSPPYRTVKGLGDRSSQRYSPGMPMALTCRPTAALACPHRLCSGMRPLVRS